jgi:ribosomal protein S19
MSKSFLGPFLLKQIQVKQNSSKKKKKKIRLSKFFFSVILPDAIIFTTLVYNATGHIEFVTNIISCRYSCLNMNNNMH